MANGKIAIVVDSCTDVPLSEIERYGMYVVPLQINYGDGSYLDKVDITPQQVYDRFAEEIPRTSTPTPAIAAEVFDRVVADGYEQAVVVTISSGLSSTFDLLRSVSAGVPHLKTLMVDTLNIGMGAGLVVLELARMVEAGATIEELAAAAPGIVANTRVYFCVDTLEYLRRGGRIGKVAFTVGSLLDVRPVISCNQEGVYYTIAKAKGRKKSLRRALDCAGEFAAKFETCTVAVADAAAADDASALLAAMRESLPQGKGWYEGQISPALVVHVGPGMVGIAVQGHAL